MNQDNKPCQKGFTTIELILVFVLVLIITSFTAPSLINLRQQTSLSTSINTLVNDLRQEQYASMAEGVDKTVRFGTNYYQMGEYIINLDSNLEFGAVSFPDQEIIFASYSGEIKNFISGQNTIVMQNLSTNKAKIATFNRLGTLINIL